MFLILEPLFSSVFIPSCLCWPPPAGSVSSRGPVTARETLLLTEKEETLPCHCRRPDRTTPCLCGGRGCWLLQQGGSRSRVQQRGGSPECWGVDTAAQIEFCDIYFGSICYGWGICLPSITCSLEVGGVFLDVFNFTNNHCHSISWCICVLTAFIWQVVTSGQYKNPGFCIILLVVMPNC